MALRRLVIQATSIRDVTSFGQVYPSATVKGLTRAVKCIWTVGRLLLLSRSQHGRMTTNMAYVMEDFSGYMSPKKYVDLAGPGTQLSKCTTLFLPQDHRESPAGAPGIGLVTECPWRRRTASPKSVIPFPSVDKWPEHRKQDAQAGPLVVNSKSNIDVRSMAPVACRFLMQVRLAALLATPDLLRAVNHMATKVSK